MTYETSPSHEQDTEPSDGAEELSIEALVVARLNKDREKPKLFGDEDDTFVGSLKRIKRFLEMDENVSVIYPGSGTHVGVARAFGKENVTHVDPDSEAIEALTDSGYKVTNSTIEDYAPAEPVDGIVALNSYGEPSTELIEKLVRPGGFVIANNYTHWAHGLAQQTGTLELIGAIMPSYMDPDAEVVDSSKIPEGATGFDTQYIILDKGNIKPGTSENHTFKDESPRYPDALFVFKRI